MTGLVMGFLFFVVDVLAIVLLVACWQRTRFNGFLLVAASYALGIVSRWATPLLYRFVESDGLEVIHVVVQLLYLGVAALAVAGFWDIYQRLKTGRNDAPPEA